MKGAGHVARVRWKIRTKFYSENLKRRDHLRDIDVNDRILLKMYIKEMR
jgi:hypothetical protein